MAWGIYHISYRDIDISWYIYIENEEESAKETEKELLEKYEGNEETVMSWKWSKVLISSAEWVDKVPSKTNISERKYVIVSNDADGQS